DPYPGTSRAQGRDRSDCPPLEMNEEQIKHLMRWRGGVARHFDFPTAAVERQFELPGALPALRTVSKGNSGPSQSQVRRIVVARGENLWSKTRAAEARQAEVRIDREFHLTFDGRLHRRQFWR